MKKHHYNRNANPGFSMVELMIALAIFAVISMTVSYFTTTSIRSNNLVNSNTSTLNQVNNVFNGINDEAKFGYQFAVSNSGHTLSFLTSDYTTVSGTTTPVTATVTLSNNNVVLSRTDGVSRNLNKRGQVTNITFTSTIPSVVDIILTVNGSIYITTVRGLNYTPSN